MNSQSEKLNRFLLIDDDLDDRELFAEALHIVDPAIGLLMAEDGESGFKIIRREDHPLPDILFLDINLPGLNGWQILKKLKEDEALRSVPVAMYSTSSFKRDKELAFEFGACCFITKPQEFKELITVLETVVRAVKDNKVNALQQYLSVQDL
ncbi:MAG: response regulator [Chitinophagaceae bacterium]|nr:MAG: response regulator [Chitinophagaceae bacterium]